MDISEIRKIAKTLNITATGVFKNELIRAIQSKEGNDACFLTERNRNCQEMNCLWREDCLPK